MEQRARLQGITHLWTMNASSSRLLGGPVQVPLYISVHFEPRPRKKNRHGSTLTILTYNYEWFQWKLPNWCSKTSVYRPSMTWGGHIATSLKPAWPLLLMALPGVTLCHPAARAKATALHTSNRHGYVWLLEESENNLWRLDGCGISLQADAVGPTSAASQGTKFSFSPGNL